MDYQELKDFIKSVAKSGISEVDIKTEEIKLSIKVYPEGKGAKHTETIIQQIPVPSFTATTPVQQMQPVQQVPAGQAPVEKKEENKEDTSNYLEIKSPIVGTFYRKPSPDKQEYVNVGDVVKADSVVCIVEAMKLFNEIEAEVSGKIVKVLVEDGTPVEFEQPLFLVEP